MSANVVSKLEVLNGYKDGWVGEHKIYIGRQHKPLKLEASPLANPYAISVYKSRAKVLNLFRDYLDKLIKEAKQGKKRYQVRALAELVQRYKAGEPIKLMCFCKPDDCHGDILVEYIKKYAREWDDDFLESQLDATEWYLQ